MSFSSIISPQRAFLIQVGVVVGFGGLIFGYNVGIIGGVIFDLTDEFGLSKVEQGLLVSLVSIGSMGGCLLGGYLADSLGRWRCV
jgi:major inositol transporter-like SP family MFS transporter